MAMVTANRNKISLYQDAKATFRSLIKQTAQVFVGFVVMLLLTGGNPPRFVLALSFCLGVGFIAWSEISRLEELDNSPKTLNLTEEISNIQPQDVTEKQPNNILIASLSTETPNSILTDKKSFPDIIITNKTLKIGHETYNLRNITKTGSYLIKPTYIVNIQGMIISFIIGMGLISIQDNTAKLIGLLIFGIGVGGIIERMTKKNKYGLKLETNAGSKTVVSSPSQEFIGDIIDKIYEVMNREDVPISYKIDIKNQSIYIG